MCIRDSFTALVVDGVRERLNERLEMGVLQCPPDFNVSETLRWVEVETQCTGEQYWVLEHSHIAPQCATIFTALATMFSATAAALANEPHSNACNRYQ